MDSISVIDVKLNEIANKIKDTKKTTNIKPPKNKINNTTKKK